MANTPPSPHSALRRLRRAGVSFAELATEAGVSGALLSYIVSGKRPLTPKTARAITAGLARLAKRHTRRSAACLEAAAVLRAQAGREWR